jgi:hypothetical protein
MDDQLQEDLDFTYATISEVINYQAGIDGLHRPEVEWLVSSWDSYVRNPHYNGQRTSSPHDDYDLEHDNEETVFVALNDNDDIPF